MLHRGVAAEGALPSVSRPNKVLAALRPHDMAIIAYCPIALGKVVGGPEIEAIASAQDRTAAQVALRWLVQQPDVVAIPKTADRATEENLDVCDFALTDAEMARMSALTRPGSRNVNEPQWVPDCTENKQKGGT